MKYAADICITLETNDTPHSYFCHEIKGALLIGLNRPEHGLVFSLDVTNPST